MSRGILLSITAPTSRPSLSCRPSFWYQSSSAQISQMVASSTCQNVNYEFTTRVLHQPDWSQMVVCGLSQVASLEPTHVNAYLSSCWWKETVFLNPLGQAIFCQSVAMRFYLIQIATAAGLNCQHHCRLLRNWLKLPHQPPTIIVRTTSEFAQYQIADEAASQARTKTIHCEPALNDFLCQYSSISPVVNRFIQIMRI